MNGSFSSKNKLLRSCALLLSLVQLCNPKDSSLPGSSVHGDSPGKNTGVGCHIRGYLTLLQGIFTTQGLNPSLLHCWRILYHLSQQGRPRILEWVAYPFSRGSSQELNRGLLHCRWILYQLSYQDLMQKQIYATSRDTLSFQSLLYGLLYKNLGHPKNTVFSKRVHGVLNIAVFRLLPILIKYNFFPLELQLLPTPCLF